MTAEQSGRIEDIASVFEQTPAILAAMEGPQLVLRAWNTACRDVAQPLFGALGAAASDLEFLRGTQTQQLLADTYTSGESFTASDWHLPLPDADGTVRDHFFDFTFVPWHWPDGRIRGVLVRATDVTEKVLKRRALERESARWEHRFRSSRDAMRTLQASLLPATVPILPGVQLAARYLLAEADTSAGGDWFSALALDDGRVALVVGDVVGHGVAAAATMGQLRAVLEDRLLEGTGIADALRALERFAARTPDAEAATVCVVLLDPESGSLEYCTAGHPPPLLVDGHSWEYLPLTGTGPLCSGQDIRVGRAQLPVDGLLLLYTDGLVERPGRDWSRSKVEIGDVAVNAMAGLPLRADDPAHIADRICRNTVELLTRTTGYTDDITVLAARHVVPAPAAQVSLRGAPQVVIGAVAALEQWLASVDAGDVDQRDLRLALVELFSNSVEHGLRERSDGHVRLSFNLARDGAAEVEVSDDGEWREPRPKGRGDTGRGLGLPLVAQLVDELGLEHDASGTRVRLRRRLRRPASLLGTEVASSPLGALDGRLTAYVLPEDPSTLRVIGPILGEGADTLRTYLDLETRGGTVPMTVDLSAVTHLASNGVRVIQQLRRAMHTQGVVLSVIAPPESTADHVLTLVGIPHLAGPPEQRHT